MNKYHEIQTVYKRDPKINYLTLLIGEYSEPEFEWLANNEWVWTEKVNGTNIRIMWDGNHVKFGGKTDNAQLRATLLTRLQDMFPQELMAHHLPLWGDDEPLCLYGEGYGPKIQKGGGNYRSDPSFVLFDVKIGQWWLQRHDVEDIAQKLGIYVVPIVGRGTLFEMVEFVRAGQKSRWGDFLAEGVVARPTIELSNRSGQRIITKLKYKDF